MSKKTTGIDLEFRPESYWDVPAAVMADMYDRVCRDFFAEVVASGQDDPQLLEIVAGVEKIEEIREFLREEDEDGLEYRAGRLWEEVYYNRFDDMPRYRFGEVSIAGVLYSATVHRDVVDVRAQWTPYGIVYQVVDEYETPYNVAIEESEKPLTLAELIQIVDCADFRTEYSGLVMGPHYLGLDPRVGSEFYEDLEEWYAIQMEMADEEELA